MEREGEREGLSRGKHVRLLAGGRNRPAKKTFMNNFTQKPKLLPGVGKKSCAQSDSNNLKIVPIIKNVEQKGDAAVCYVMNLEERRLSDDALNFQTSTSNHSNIWHQEIKFNLMAKCRGVRRGTMDLAGIVKF